MTSSLKMKKQPGKSSIKSRSSTMNAEFAKSKIPYLKVSPNDLTNRYKLFFKGALTKRTILRCFYCDGHQSEWDHLFSPLKKKKVTKVVKKAVKKPKKKTKKKIVVKYKDQASGYFHEANNLIPACNKCNTSKGNTHFSTWMLSKSKDAEHNLIRKHMKIKRVTEKEAIIIVKNKVKLINTIIQKHKPKKIKFRSIHNKNADIKKKEANLKDLQIQIGKYSVKATKIAKDLSQFYTKHV